MTQNAFVRARISEDIKNRAAAVLDTMGLTVSDACRILLTKVAQEKQFPFDLNAPNSETAQTKKIGAKAGKEKASQALIGLLPAEVDFNQARAERLSKK